jgi:hypothetical protein
VLTLRGPRVAPIPGGLPPAAALALMSLPLPAETPSISRAKADGRLEAERGANGEKAAEKRAAKAAAADYAASRKKLMQREVRKEQRERQAEQREKGVPLSFADSNLLNTLDDVYRAPPFPAPPYRPLAPPPRAHVGADLAPGRLQGRTGPTRRRPSRLRPKAQRQPGSQRPTRSPLPPTRRRARAARGCGPPGPARRQRRARRTPGPRARRWPGRLRARGLPRRSARGVTALAGG